MSNKNSFKNKSRLELLHEFEIAPLTALFKQETVCAIRDCSSATAERDRWMGCGIPFLKIGRSVRYKKVDILAFVDVQSATSTSEFETAEKKIGASNVGGAA